ncbi:glycosyltransferase family 2 protein [Marisediminicola sp. LYQ85]|uniref:glycosyltransferase family 2 protein n=1 Tax=Marisediminicola sp. LYQ85 TaxID=3391062 RepID=UPI003983CA68
MSSTSRSAALGVVIPAFNAEAKLPAAVESALALGVSPENVIVVDDGSSDRTAEVASTLGCTVVSQLNAGAASARRAGVLATSLPYVILLDADDTLEVAGIDESFALAERSDEWAAVMGGTLASPSEHGHHVAMNPWPEGVSVETLLRRGFSPGPPAAFLWRTAVLHDMYASSHPLLAPAYAEDYEMLIRGAKAGLILTHTTPACRYALVGGKSARAPLADNRAAEVIRVHYAHQYGVALTPRRDSELRSMAHFRTAYSKTGWAGAPGRALHYLLAAVADPRFVSGLFLRKIRRSFARHS